MVLLRNHTPTGTFDSKYKPSLQICKTILDMTFEVQDNIGKMKWVLLQHLQLLYPVEHVLTNPTDINSFGCTTKYINHPTWCQIWVPPSKQISDMFNKYMHQKET